MNGEGGRERRREILVREKAEVESETETDRRTQNEDRSRSIEEYTKAQKTESRNG